MRTDVLEKLLNAKGNENIKFSVENGFNKLSYSIRIKNKDGYTNIVAEISNSKKGLFTIYGSEDLSNRQLKRIRMFAETPIGKREPFKPKDAVERLRYRLMEEDDIDNEAFNSSLVDDDLAQLTFINFGSMVICYFHYDKGFLSGETPEPDAIFTFDLNSLDVKWINPRTNFKIKKVILDFQNELHEKGSFDLNLVESYESKWRTY